MTKFFFHFFDGESVCEDDSGLELASVEDAYLEAVAGARAMWPELLEQRSNPNLCAFSVAGADGVELFRLDFLELIEDCRGSGPRGVSAPEAMSRTLTETHDRVTTARESLRNSFDAVYKSLQESNSLLARLALLERPHASYNRDPGAAAKPLLPLRGAGSLG